MLRLGDRANVLPHVGAQLFKESRRWIDPLLQNHEANDRLSGEWVALPHHCGLGDGVVVEVDRDGDRGEYLDIELRDGTRVRYMHLLHTIGELCLSPMGLSLVTRLAPPRLVGLAMGGWFLATAFGNNLSGFLGGIQGMMPPELGVGAGVPCGVCVPFAGARPHLQGSP